MSRNNSELTLGVSSDQEANVGVRGCSLSSMLRAVPRWFLSGWWWRPHHRQQGHACCAVSMLLYLC